MKMSGERLIPAPRARVWEALNDPEVLRQSIPGCQEMIQTSPTDFSAKVMAKVGPVKANFAGDVKLSNLNPPHSYLISGKGTGGVAGFAEGGAEVRLEEENGNTRLIYDVDAKVGGKLAQIGSRLIDSTARRMADEFFQRFADVVGSAETQGLTMPEAQSEPPETAMAAIAPARKSPVRKAPGGKAVAGKSASRKAAGKSPAVDAQPAESRRTGRTRGETSQSPAGSAMADAPSLIPEAAIVRSTASPPRATPDRPSQAPTNVWWMVVAGLGALLVILVLANW